MRAERGGRFGGLQSKVGVTHPLRIAERAFGGVMVAGILLILAGCPDPDQFELVNSIGGYGTEVGRFRQPMGIDYTIAGNLTSLRYIVADYGNDRVQVVPSRAGDRPQHTLAFGTSGTGPGQFSGPAHVAVPIHSASDDLEHVSVYVTDSRNNRVQQFDLTGRFIRMWGTEGDQPGEFRTPVGVSVDVSGNVYVVDSGNHRVQVFDSTGRYLHSWGSFGSAPGQFAGPIDITALNDTLGSNNRTRFLVVTDHGNDRIQWFTPEGTIVSEFAGIRGPLGISSMIEEIEVVCEGCRGYWVGNRSGMSYLSPIDLEDPYDLLLIRTFTERGRHRISQWKENLGAL